MQIDGDHFYSIVVAGEHSYLVWIAAFEVIKLPSWTRSYGKRNRKEKYRIVCSWL
jgi:hypothetical protein